MSHPGHHDLVCECGIRLGGCRCFAPGKSRLVVSPCRHVPHTCREHPEVRVQALPDDYARCPFCSLYLTKVDSGAETG